MNSTAAPGSDAISPHTATRVVFAAAWGDLGEELEHRGIKGVGERGDGRVASFCCGCVLGEVVGADAYQVDEGHRGAGPQGERGDLGHGADLERVSLLTARYGSG
jgi:hypothetical protein